jgi:hypothetical protein
MKRIALLLALAPLGAPGHAADLGRLFYTPAERAQLEAARARNVTGERPGAAPAAAPPQRFDGVVIRSDGTATRWVNGRPHAGAPAAGGLKPGQTRAGGRVYEPYQLLPSGTEAAR